MKAAFNDVGVTGNVNWANIAAEASEFLDPSRPSIFVNPSVTYAQSFTSITIGAIISNSNSDIIWSATNGTITGSGRSITFSASFFGQATVTAQLVDDPTVSATCVVRTTFDGIRR